MYHMLVVPLIFILIFLTWCYAQKRKFQSLKDFHGPKTYPIIGNVLEFGFNLIDIFNNLQRVCETYKPVVKLWIGPSNLYLLSVDPEFNEFLLNSPKCLKKAREYRYFKYVLRNGLVVSDGTYWQKRRKLVTPAFHFKIIDGFLSTFHLETDIFIERLSKHVGKGVFNVHPYIADLTLDIICETAMGTSANAQGTINNEYVNALNISHSLFTKRLFSAWKWSEILFRCTNDYKVLQKCLKTIHGFSKSVIEERRKKLLNKTPHEEEAVDIGMKKKQVFLDILLTSTIDGQPLSDTDVQQEVDTFLIAGHETITILVALAMYELARNPDIQAKLFSEVREIFCDDKNYKASLHDLNNLKYTELVIKETMRMYPPIPFIGREMEEDTNFKGTIIPKETQLGIFIYGMQRRADLYPNPNSFDPERFLPENNINPYAYLPFSAGPRNCIGLKFGMYETKYIIAKIIMNFEILRADAKDDVQLYAAVILHSMNGVNVKLQPRQFNK